MTVQSELEEHSRYMYMTLWEVFIVATSTAYPMNITPISREYIQGKLYVFYQKITLADAFLAEGFPIVTQRYSKWYFCKKMAGGNEKELPKLPQTSCMYECPEIKLHHSSSGAVGLQTKHTVHFSQGATVLQNKFESGEIVSYSRYCVNMRLANRLVHHCPHPVRVHGQKG